MLRFVTSRTREETHVSTGTVGGRSKFHVYNIAHLAGRQNFHVSVSGHQLTTASESPRTVHWNTSVMVS